MRHLATRLVSLVSSRDRHWNDWVVGASKSPELGFEGFGEYETAGRKVTGVDAWLI
jgi:hypothetical protein